jgi:acetate---CoA ligase (ADP-forming)
MKSDQDLIAQIDKLFHPRSVAVVAAPRGMKTGTVFLMALLEQGFSGPIYPVNPLAEEISEIKAYPKVAFHSSQGFRKTPGRSGSSPTAVP